MATDITPEMNAVIERQVAYFSSDQCLLDRAAHWRHATREECWAATADACDYAHEFLEMQSPAVQTRARNPERISDDLLATLAGHGTP